MNARPKRQRRGVKDLLAADSVLTAAVSIAREARDSAETTAHQARDSDVEIDWTRSPFNDYESELRAAIIRRTVAEALEEAHALSRSRRQLEELFPEMKPELADELTVARRERGAASSVRWALEGLLDDPTVDTIGADLYDAVEHWRVIEDERDKRARELERKRLIDAARLDIGS
jgi:hypothetical protein